MTAVPSPTISPATGAPVATARSRIAGPSVRDPRLHVSAVILTIHVLGQVWLDFAVSVPQIAAAVLSCAVVDVVIVAATDRRIVWPGSAILTGSGVALILRDVGTDPGDHWTVQRWWLFSLVATGSLLTKYVLRRNGANIFNPSNIGLVVAFVALGESRIEPLDFWWVPFGPAMLLAYTVILAGGLAITDRLRLLGVAATFWAVLASVLSASAVVGHTMTVAWSVSPIEDWHFWWVVVTSPETLIFSLFMVTDPRIVPVRTAHRIWFASATAVASGLLIAPQSTEFGAKVGLLGGLVVSCAARAALAAVPALEGRLAAIVERHSARLALGALMVSILATAVVTSDASPLHTELSREELSGMVDAVEPDDLPAITVDPGVSALSETVLDDGGVQAVSDLLLALRIEALAVRDHRPELLESVDHGRRLLDMRAAVDAVPRTVSDHRIEASHLTVERLAGQGAARLGVRSCGWVENVVLDADGREVERDRQPLSITFVLRLGTDGRWIVVGTLPHEC